MAYTEQDIKRLCKGRTEEQKKVIRYFLGGGGCLSKTMSDEEYEAAVMAKARSMDFKQKALNKIGLDESQVNEIEPVHFEGYYFDEKKTYAKWGKDRKWRSSAYQISWISSLILRSMCISIHLTWTRMARRSLLRSTSIKILQTSQHLLIPSKKKCSKRLVARAKLHMPARMLIPTDLQWLSPATSSTARWSSPITPNEQFRV